MEKVLTDLVIVDGSSSITGGLRAAVRISRAISPHVRTHLVVPRGGSIRAADLEPFASVTRIPRAAISKKAGSLVSYFPASIWGSIIVRQLLRRTGASVLVLNDFPQMHGWLVRRLGFVGTIITFVRFAPNRFPKYLTSLWLSAAAGSSNRVIAVSKFVQDQLPSMIKSELLYDSVDPSLMPATVTVRRPQRVVCIGNYIRGKGQDDALKAFAKIAPQFPGATLAFYGGDMGLSKNARYRLELQAWSDREGLAEQVEFHPFEPKISEPLGSATAAMNLSRSESFSFTCLEAAQMEVPMIAYRSGGPEEIIIDGKTGFLCPLGDIDFVANRLERLLSSRYLAGRMGREARVHVLKRFGPAEFAKALRALIEPW